MTLDKSPGARLTHAKPTALDGAEPINDLPGALPQSASLASRPTQAAKPDAQSLVVVTATGELPLSHIDVELISTAEIFGGLRRYVQSRLRDAAKAHELVQEAYKIVLEKARAGYQVRSSKGYIFGVARLLVLREFNPKARDFTEFNSGADSVLKLRRSGRLSHQVGASLAVRNALEKLPMDQQTLVEIRLCQGLTLEECAVALGRPLITVRRELERALKALRAELGPLMDGAELESGKPSPELAREWRHW